MAEGLEHQTDVQAGSVAEPVLIGAKVTEIPTCPSCVWKSKAVKLPDKKKARDKHMRNNHGFPCPRDCLRSAKMKGVLENISHGPAPAWHVEERREEGLEGTKVERTTLKHVRIANDRKSICWSTYRL